MHWFVLGLFIFALLFGISRLVGKAALSKLVLRPGEQVLFERDGIRVRSELGNARSVLLLRAFVRVTTERVIVGAGKLARPHRCTITRVMSLDADDLGNGPLDDGYVTYGVSRADVRVEDGEVRLPTRPGSRNLGVPVRVALVAEAKALEPLRAAIVDRQLEPLPANTALDGYRA